MSYMKLGVITAIAIISSLLFTSCDEPVGSEQRLNCSDFLEDLELYGNGIDDVDFIIDCIVEIPNGVNIVISEEATVAFEAGAGIIVQPGGQLVVLGFIDQENVQLIGSDDVPGHWNGIVFQGNEPSRCSYALIKNAGAQSDSRFKGVITVDGKASVADNTFESSLGYALYIDENANQFEARNVYNSGSSYPIYCHRNSLVYLGGENTFNNNNPDRILIEGGTMTEGSTAFPNDGYAYEFTSSLIANASISFSKGGTFIFPQNSKLELNNTFTTDLSANNADHATFTCLSKQKGAWDGIIINHPATPISIADKFYNATIEYGGGGNTLPANLAIVRGKVNVKNCNFIESSACGISYDETEVEFGDFGGNIFLNNSGGSICPN